MPEMIVDGAKLVLPEGLRFVQRDERLQPGDEVMFVGGNQPSTYPYVISPSQYGLLAETLGEGTWAARKVAVEPVAPKKAACAVQFKSEIDVTLVQHMGGDHMMVAAARVCTTGEEACKLATGESTAEHKGLINYLMKHRHGTPFEHGAMTFYVHAPIFVWREWHRHRIGFSYNEESGRYKQLEPVFWLPPRDRPMMKVEEWKAGRPKFTVCEHDLVYENLCHNLKQQYESAYAAYERNLGLGVDPGLARDCLPVGIFSGCWVTCNPRSLMAFLSLRTHTPDAKQVSYPLWEIDHAARKCEALFAEHWPITYAAFCENGRVAP